ncbi:hypothetical protein A3K69_05895 [Candidatus Bathyarchaeota archaeon RBG_16_57_9]|nr:MAG: hypothetical protein A3K69_05895 [Candidatus Bathyarchaeota archaeon RBG_16_57_9]
MALIVEGRVIGLLSLLIIAGSIIYYMQRAYSGKLPKLRRLAAVNQIDEILGRCVEMGRPAYYLMDTVTMDNPSVLAPTVAAFQILAYTARSAARLGARFFVPVTQGLAYTIASEIVDEAYKAENKQDELKLDEAVMYLPDGADRMYIINHMWSDGMAGAFFLGSWYHKAVIFTENAARVGAMMLGGTDTTHNIPFLVAICDYSIIGEELYALGAYVSEDPTVSSSLAGQDVGKFIAVILIVLGSVLITLGMSIKGLLSM